MIFGMLLSWSETSRTIFSRAWFNMPDFRDVDPRELRVPPSRRQGADPAKLGRQISLFGRSALGMPPP